MQKGVCVSRGDWPFLRSSHLMSQAPAGPLANTENDNNAVITADASLMQTCTTIVYAVGA